jgi:hypothetical protein
MTILQVSVSDHSHNYVKDSSEAATTSEAGSTLTSSKSKKEQ